MSDSSDLANSLPGPHEPKARNSMASKVRQLEVRTARGERQRKWFWVAIVCLAVALAATSINAYYYQLVTVPERNQVRNHQILCLQIALRPPNDSKRTEELMKFNCSATDIRNAKRDVRDHSTSKSTPSPSPTRSSQSERLSSPTRTARRTQPARHVTTVSATRALPARTHSTPPRTSTAPRPAPTRTVTHTARPTPTPTSTCLAQIAGICVHLG